MATCKTLSTMVRRRVGVARTLATGHLGARGPKWPGARAGERAGQITSRPDFIKPRCTLARRPASRRPAASARTLAQVAAHLNQTGAGLSKCWLCVVEFLRLGPQLEPCSCRLSLLNNLDSPRRPAQRLAARLAGSPPTGRPARSGEPTGPAGARRALGIILDYHY